MLAFSNSASGDPVPPGVTNLTISDQHELGMVLPGVITGDTDVTYYVSTMIALSVGGSIDLNINGQNSLVARSLHAFRALPTAALTLGGMSTTVNLGSQGTYTYLFAKYNGPYKGAEVWYVADLSGVITIPSNWGQFGLSGWALVTDGPQSVPDGGATVLMLGVALGTLGVVRRYLLN
jgi:hypothetical protein